MVVVAVYDDEIDYNKDLVDQIELVQTLQFKFEIFIVLTLEK